MGGRFLRHEISNPGTEDEMETLKIYKYIKQSKDVGLHFKQLLSAGVRSVVRDGSGEERGEKKKEKNLITPTDGGPIQRKCQKAPRDSRSTCEREAHRGGTRRLCRWLYEQRDDGKPITNVSVSSYFRGQNNLCAESSCAPPFVQILPFFLSLLFLYLQR